MTLGSYDIVAAELHRKAIENLTNQMAIAMVRTSGSPIVYEAKDFCTCLFDTEPEQLGFSGYVLLHIASSLGGVQSINDYVDFDDLKPGDGFITNDPRCGGAMHQADIGIIMPLFYRDEHLGWGFANMHVMDIGGVGISGFAPGARDVYQEGLRFPPTRIIRDGRIDKGWERFIAANVRTPGPVLNDIRSMIAANNVVANQRLTQIIDEFGLSDYKALNEINKSLSEQLFRERIERIPDGTYTTTDWHEFDGHDGDDMLLEMGLTLTVSGSELNFEFSGAPQIGAYVNSAQEAMAGNCMSALMVMLVYGDLPVNAGLWRPVNVSVGEPGTIVNSLDPAPCSNAHAEVGMRGCKMTKEVLSQALSLSDDPELRGRVAGQGHDGFPGAALFGSNQHKGISVMFYTDNASGAGGGAQTIIDGQDAYGATCQTGGGIGEVETHEAMDPVLWLWRSIVPNSGGPGLFRGGQGIEQGWSLQYTDALAGPAFNSCAEVPPRGFGGGFPGSTSTHYPFSSTNLAELVSRGELGTKSNLVGSRELVRSKIGHMVVKRGDVQVWQSGGGGGIGDPLLRSPQLVALDLRDGYITEKHANNAYGVVVSADGNLDEAATRERRVHLRRRRIGSDPQREAGVPDDAGVSIVVRIQDGTRVWACACCEDDLGAVTSNWRTDPGVAMREAALHERFAELDMYVRQRTEIPGLCLREYFCRSCAAALSVEVVTAGMAPLPSPALA